jgi:hypothetical protein
LDHLGTEAHKADPRNRAAVRQQLQAWQTNPDLAGVRGKAVALLPDAERLGWKQLWADVDALRRRLGQAR